MLPIFAACAIEIFMSAICLVLLHRLRRVCRAICFAAEAVRTPPALGAVGVDCRDEAARVLGWTTTASLNHVGPHLDLLASLEHEFRQSRGAHSVGPDLEFFCSDAGRRSEERRV